MQANRNRSGSRLPTDRAARSVVHRDRKRVGLDKLRLMKLPKELFDSIPLAIN